LGAIWAIADTASTPARTKTPTERASFIAVNDTPRGYARAVMAIEPAPKRPRLSPIVLLGMIATALGLLLLTMLYILSKRMNAPPPPPPAQAVEAPRVPALGAVPPFSLTAQDGSTVTNETLAGKVWIANFFLTECAGICPAMTGRMRGLTEKLAGEKGVAFVSFDVIPTATPWKTSRPTR
jgi:hypothetical protein